MRTCPNYYHGKLLTDIILYAAALNAITTGPLDQ